MAESQRAIEKEKISSTEFPEGGNTIYTKRTPRHPNGGCKSLAFRLNTFEATVKKSAKFGTEFPKFRQ